MRECVQGQGLYISALAPEPERTLFFRAPYMTRDTATLEEAEELMTVCVAVISEGRIIGASDRMLSAGDLAFEPMTRKAHVITNAIFAMVSGDSAAQIEIVNALRSQVEAIVRAPNADWMTVESVARLYQYHWGELKRRRAEAAILAPLGMNSYTFIQDQQKLDPGVASRAADAIVGFQIPYVSCLIVGVDHFGPHIWSFEAGNLFCHDTVGFACIGSGQRHAESQLMLAQYASGVVRFPDAIVAAHTAKKRAETTPSVGEASDMFIIGPQLGQNVVLMSEHVDQLDRGFTQLQNAEKKALAKTGASFEKYLAKLVEQETHPVQEVEETDWLSNPSDIATREDV